MNARLLLIAITIASCTGCKPQEDPLVQQSRQRFLVNDFSGDPSPIVALAGTTQLPSEVTIAGRIYGGELSPFDPDVATFTIIELPEPGHSHDDPGDCPFCKHKADNAAMAVVQVLDEQGQPLGVPANKLLGLKTNQDVVVTGTPSKVGDLLMVNASAIHVLSEDAAQKLAAKFDREAAGE